MGCNCGGSTKRQAQAQQRQQPQAQQVVQGGSIGKTWNGPQRPQPQPAPSK